MNRVTFALAAFACWAAVAGCSQSNGESHASTSGYFAIAQAGGRTKLYAPAVLGEACQPARLAVLDPSASSRGSALRALIDLGVTDTDVTSVGADGEDVVVVGLAPHVWFIDPRTDTVKKRLDLPGDTPGISVSDRGAASLGVIVDASRRRAWASVWNGILELDLDAMEVVRTLPAAPPENLAFDRTSGLLAVPFYECAPAGVDGPPCDAYRTADGSAMTDGLAFLDVSTGARYVYRDATAAEPTRPLGLRPDVVVYDFGLGLALVPAEADARLEILDLGALSLDASAGACSAPRVSLQLPGNEYGALAVDETTHTAILAREFDDHVLLVDLQRARAGELVARDLHLPPTPAGSPWAVRADPHGIFVAELRGRPTVFVANVDRSAVARIDLLLALARPVPPPSFQTGTVTVLSTALPDALLACP